MFYKQNGIVAGILLLILFAGAIGLVSVQMDKTVNRMHYSVAVSYTHLYNGSANFEIADLSDYNLMNAEEKLEYEVRSGLYEKSSKPGWTDDKLDAYNRILKLVKEGNDVDWLSIPVRELGVGHKHTVMAEGGNAVSYTHLSSVIVFGDPVASVGRLPFSITDRRTVPGEPV